MRGLTLWLNIRCPECRTVNRDIEVYYVPGEDAYPTSNPDHPRYDDDGCDEECEIVGEGKCVGRSASLPRWITAMRCPFDFASGTFVGELLDLARDRYAAECESEAESRAMDRWDDEND